MPNLEKSSTKTSFKEKYFNLYNKKFTCRGEKYHLGETTVAYTLLLPTILTLILLFVLILMAFSSRRARIDRRRTSIYKARKREIESRIDSSERARRRRGRARTGELDSLFAGGSEEPRPSDDDDDYEDFDDDDDDEGGFFSLFR